MKNDQSYPGEDGARGNCGKSRLFWKAQIVCVSVCVRERMKERGREGVGWREILGNSDLTEHKVKGQTCSKSQSQSQYVRNFNYQVFSLLQSRSLALGKVKVKVTQSCPTLCGPMDYTVQGTLQARILEWVAFPFTRGYSRPRNRTRVSCIAGRFFTNWAMRQALALGKTWSNSNPVPSHDSYSHQAFCLSVSLMPVKRNSLGTTCSSLTMPTRRQETRLGSTIYSFLISHEK